VRTKEKIICSAVKVEGVSEKLDDIYLGLRHNHCFAEVARRREVLEVDDSLRVEMARNKTQGFLTSENRFVDRFEGMIIAVRNNQLIANHGEIDKLYSEDLY